MIKHFCDICGGEVNEVNSHTPIGDSGIMMAVRLQISGTGADTLICDECSKTAADSLVNRVTK